MKFDYSYQAFKAFTPDEPNNVDFEAHFPDGLYVVEMTIATLGQILNQNSVSLNKKIIESDVSREKWDQLKARVQAGLPVSIPWGRMHKGKLAIVQGKHRFQYQIANDYPHVTFGISKADLTILEGLEIPHKSFEAI